MDDLDGVCDNCDNHTLGLTEVNGGLYLCPECIKALGDDDSITDEDI